MKRFLQRRPKTAVIIDVGTTNLKVALINDQLEILAKESARLAKKHPRPGYSEQNPHEILELSLELVARLGDGLKHCAGVGITNQRESVASWQARDLKPRYPLIVWEDDRTEPICRQLAWAEADIRQKTGLFLSPYYSASKIKWLISNIGLGRSSQDRVGTVDSWLLANLTGTHATDFTNASRTMLFNIHSLKWDEQLLDIFAIPKQLLATARPSRNRFGVLAKKYFGVNKPILAVAGDQQASLYAAGNQAGVIKVTYGTGIFPMKIIGSKFELYPQLATTLAIGSPDRWLYALEGYVKYAAQRVGPVLHDSSKLKTVVRQLARETQPLLATLIDQPDQAVVVDGGISQNDHLLKAQAQLNRAKIIRQRDPEGAVVGIAKLIFNQ